MLTIRNLLHARIVQFFDASFGAQEQISKENGKQKTIMK